VATNPKNPFIPQFLPIALAAAYDYSNTETNIPSVNIRQSMTLVYARGETFGTLNVPFYWSKAYHDGRDAIHLKDDRVMIYYKDPKDDPRLNTSFPNYPIRRSDRRRLLRSTISADQKAGKLIVTKKVGSTTGHPFFSDSGGMAGFDKELDRVASKECDIYVAKQLQAAGLLNKKVSVTI